LAFKWKRSLALAKAPFFLQRERTNGGYRVDDGDCRKARPNPRVPAILDDIGVPEQPKPALTDDEAREEFPIILELFKRS
jgi:hypothetical protein